MVAPELHPISTVHPPFRRINCPTNTTSTACMDYGLRLTESLTVDYSDAVLEALDDLPDSFLLTDSSISGHPVVFASRAFLSMSGYSRADVLGRNARMFQGPATDRRSVMEIREAVRSERKLQLPLLNYRKDGTPYWILLHLCPVVRESDGCVVHFLAVQVPIRKRRGSSGPAPVLLLGSCRDEVARQHGGCGGHGSVLVEFDSFDDADSRGLEAEESRVATDVEKQKATNAAKTILSILTYYRKHTDRLIGGKRSCSASIMPLNSSLNICLGRIKQSFVLTDPHLPDMPIVYASDAFLNMTGYSRNDVLGRNCRFLTGPGTDGEVLHQIKDSIRREQPCTACILNYRKDGSSFWNCLHISPVRNATGKVAYYVGVQIDESGKGEHHGLSPEMRQLSVVGSVKVAVRSLSAVAPSTSRSQ
ncbi:protein TWIN LOV 1 [Iris pallida]|uniref:Protein TWIN LOV 1 n=1 Tax=Iris pallida TaxID=29817 RepID=A0AAX6DQ81_IRIPA|nr:protein TWIN LOV 1 [Iris pallida]